MEYVGVVAFLLCIVHFLYQRVYLPSVRQSARDELFQLRDELRDQLLEIQSDVDKNTLLAFKEIDDGINRSLNRLHLLTFTHFVTVMRAYESDKEHYEKSKKDFDSILDNSVDATPREIYVEVNKVLHNVLVANSLMFTLYLLPIYLVIRLIGSIYSKVKAGSDYLVDSVIENKRPNSLMRC
ncbi:hypothetical protein ACFXIQ_002584 [Vibrio vulnificus]|nr:hypothetical protein [Vibrio parahaemolyticus]HDM8209896.1 hypothetical protein [Vibrio campbellii]